MPVRAHKSSISSWQRYSCIILLITLSVRMMRRAASPSRPIEMRCKGAPTLNITSYSIAPESSVAMQSTWKYQKKNPSRRVRRESQLGRSISILIFVVENRLRIGLVWWILRQHWKTCSFERDLFYFISLHFLKYYALYKNSVIVISHWNPIEYVDRSSMLVMVPKIAWESKIDDWP